MLTILFLAAAVTAGAPWLLIGSIGLALASPWVFLGAVVGWTVLRWRRRRRAAGPDAEAALLRSLAAELAAGSSMRAALVTAARRVPDLDLTAAVRLAGAGMSADRVGRELAERMPSNGVAASAAFRLASSSGGPVGPIFDALARRADDHGRLARERRALTAQARLSAWIVGGGPLVLVGVGMTTGLGPDPAGLGAAGAAVVSIGVGLIVIGAAVVWLMIRRAEA